MLLKEKLPKPILTGYHDLGKGQSHKKSNYQNTTLHLQSFPTATKNFNRMMQQSLQALILTNPFILPCLC